MSLVKEHNPFIEVPEVAVVCSGKKINHKFPVI